MRKISVIEEGVLKGKNAFGVVLHFIERCAPEPRLQIERLIVALRPALLFEELRDVFARIGGKDARARIDGCVGNEQRCAQQCEKSNDAEQDGEQNKGDPSDDFHGAFPPWSEFTSFSIFLFSRTVNCRRGKLRENRRPLRAAGI